MRINHAKAGMVLASDIIDGNGNLLLERGIALTENYIARLKQLGIDNISIKFSLPDNAVPKTVITDELQLKLSSCFKAVYTMKTHGVFADSQQKMYFRHLESTSDSVIAEVETAMPNILNMKIRRPTIDEIAHAVNVCLLSVVTGFYLKLPRPALRQLALGALLHDIGKAVIPLINNKPVNSPNMHPLYGRDLLLKHRLGSTTARIAAEHHEHYNGSGFPLGLSGKATHPLARIVSIANYFDNAVTQAAVNGTPLPQIIESLLATGDILFDHNTLRAFIHTTPIYTLGSIVTLSTGQTGYIAQNRAHYPLRPLIRVITKTGYDDLDLAHHPSITITDVVEDYSKTELAN